MSRIIRYIDVLSIFLRVVTKLNEMKKIVLHLPKSVNLNRFGIKDFFEAKLAVTDLRADVYLFI